MAGLTNNERTAIISELTTNCDCWKAQGDIDVLNSFTDGKLQELRDSHLKATQAVSLASAAVKGFSDGKRDFALDPKTGRWMTRPTANADNEEEEEEEEVDPDAEEEEEEEVVPAKKKKPMPPETNSRTKRPQTVEQFIRSAPPAIRDALELRINQAADIENREKMAIITKLLVNVAPSEKQAHVQRLMARSLDDLKIDLTLIPQVQVPEQPDQTRNTRRKVVHEEDILIAPTMNWSEVGSKPGGEQVVNDGSADDTVIDEDEIIRKLPPSLRGRVMNAVAVDARERRRIIDELVDNIYDDAQESQVRSELEKLSLNQLQTMLAIKPPKEERKTPNFFGSPGFGRIPTNSGNATDDLLPTPVMNYSEDK